jgi:ABC-type Fe3+ transport system substrate-binding protein
MHQYCEEWRMKKHLLKWLWMAGALTMTLGWAQAQTVDPKLAASWAYMQKEMPGVPYSVLKAACDEGHVMIYHGTWDEAQDAQIAGFKKRFPCMSVEKFTTTMGALRERFLSEFRAGRRGADIYQESDTGTLDIMAGNKTLANYKISNDAAFRPGAKKTGYWYPLRIALVGIAWNTDLVSPEEAKLLTDWKGVANPAWKGRAAVVDPSGGGVAFLPWYAWTKLYGPGFIDQIGALRPRVTAAINTAAAALASGDVAVLLNASETGLLPLWLKGAPIRWSLPSPAIGPLTGQGIPSNAPHPNAAKLYQEYSFTEEGYGLWQKLGGAPARTGFKDERKVAAESWYKMPSEIFAYDPADATAAAPTVNKHFTDVVTNRK